jgi:hypothetical protein
MVDSIALNLYGLSFNELAGFSKKIYDGFIQHAVDYPSPNPPMATFLTHINKLKDDIADWGVTGNRGAHRDYVALVTSAGIVRSDLQSLSDYAKSAQRNNPQSWANLGFPLRKQREKNGILEEVQDLRHFISRDVPAPGIKLKWKLPLNTKRNLVRGYIIQCSSTPDYPTDPRGRMLMNVIGIVTETTFIDRQPLPGANWYWVTPFNSSGTGVTSNGLLVLSAQLTEA